MTSAINLLSNGKFENQKPSVYTPLRALISTFFLFPLDGARWLGGDVVDDAVYASDFIADSTAHFVEYFPREAEVVGGHTIRGGDGTDAYGVVIGSFIALDADGTDRCRKDGEGLPDGVVETMLMNDISHDEVRTAQDIETFRGDVADDTDGKARSREWLTIDDFFRKAQLTAELADFVFEEFTKRFDEGEFHILRETAYIMMGLDGRSSRGAGFYDVRIEGSLYEEFHIFELVRFFLEGMNEFCTDGLTFLFRFGDAFQKRHEVLGCIDVYQLHVEFVRKGIDDLFCFAETQEAVVDENAGQLIADGFVYEDSCDRGVDAAGEGADDIVISNFFTDIFDSDVDVVAHGPAAFTFADVEEEVLQHGGAFRGVDDLGMELDSVEAAGFICHRSSRGEVGVTGESEAGRHLCDGIAMAHPYRCLFGDAFEECGAAVSVEIGVTVFMFFRFRNFAAQGLGHELHAVADAEDRHTCFEYVRIDLRRIFRIDAGWAAGENDPLRLLG